MKYVHLAARIYSKDMAVSGVRDYIYISTGFGVGASAVLNGALYEGAQSNAGELGTLLGSIRSYLPADLYRDTEKYLQQPENAELYGWLKAQGTDLFSSSNAMMKTVDLAVERGDAYIRSLLDKTAVSIAKLCGILAGFFDPQAIIIGGDVSKTTPHVWEAIEKEIKKDPSIKCTVMTTDLGKSRFEMTAMRLVDYAYEDIYTELIEKQ